MMSVVRRLVGPRVLSGLIFAGCDIGGTDVSVSVSRLVPGPAGEARLSVEVRIEGEGLPVDLETEVRASSGRLDGAEDDTPSRRRLNFIVPQGASSVAERVIWTNTAARREVRFDVVDANDLPLATELTTFDSSGATALTIEVDPFFIVPRRSQNIDVHVIGTNGTRRVQLLEGTKIKIEVTDLDQPPTIAASAVSLFVGETSSLKIATSSATRAFRVEVSVDQVDGTFGGCRVVQRLGFDASAVACPD